MNDINTFKDSKDSLFPAVIGQEQALSVLEGMLRSERIPHALMFAGPWGVGKGEAAFNFAGKLLCEKGADAACGTCGACIRAAKLEHPDLHVLFPFRSMPDGAESRNGWLDELASHRQRLAGEPYAPIVYEKGRQIVKGLVEDVRDRLMESSLEGGRKVCVILGADRLNRTTGNLLLKILEEPPAGVHFILTTERLSTVLPTITSRSSMVRFRRLRPAEIVTYLESAGELPADRIVSIAQSADGSIKTARSLAFEDHEDFLTGATTMYLETATGRPDSVIGQVVPFLWSRDELGAEELLNGFVHCTRTVLNASQGRITAEKNGIHAGEIAALAERTDIGSLHRLAHTLEDGLEMLGRHVNISTVLSTVLYEINDTFR